MLVQGPDPSGPGYADPPPFLHHWQLVSCIKVLPILTSTRVLVKVLILRPRVLEETTTRYIGSPNQETIMRRNDMRNVYLYPKFHFLRHVTTRQARRRASRDVLSCVLRRACSSMADDEEAVLVVTDVSRFLRSS